MIPFRRILFPVDYSEPCQAVVPWVKDILRHFPAELTLVHAFGAEALGYSELPLADPELPTQAQSIQDDQLHSFAENNFPGYPVSCLAVCGEPGSAIGGVVQHQSTDLVMLPTHGRGPVRRFLLGSVTTKVLHDVSAAVWTGTGAAINGHAPGSARGPSLHYHSILCALDGTPESECVLRAAVTIASVYGAHLSIIRVVEPMPATEFDMMPYQQDRIEAARFSLRELLGTVGVDQPYEVIEAPVAEGVRQQARRLKADLVITGRGHSQGVFTTLRSHLYQIIRESPCPVLSV